jgi:hypothetical protein
MSINPMVGSSLTCTSPVFCSNYVQEIEVEPSNVGNTTEGNKVRMAGLLELMTVAWSNRKLQVTFSVYFCIYFMNSFVFYKIKHVTLLAPMPFRGCLLQSGESQKLF